MVLSKIWKNMFFYYQSGIIEFCLQQHINENFARLAEALYIADRSAREAVEQRALVERRIAQSKKVP